jgi:hypothetical protein
MTLPTLLLSHVHHIIARELGEAERAAYYRQPLVWKDFQDVYQPLLGKDADAFYYRTCYTSAAVDCGQCAEAIRHFELLGEDFSRLAISPKRYHEKWEEARKNMK